MRLPLLTAMIVVLAGPVGLGACSSGATPTPKKPTGATAPGTAGATSLPVPGKDCAYQQTGGAARDVGVPPQRPPLPSTLTLEMQVGRQRTPVTIALDGATAPCTVAAISYLAAHHYYDATRCHRLVTAGIFVLQCGDPTATGSGGPGFTIPDEATGKEQYPAGTVAMARTSQPDSGGSQFFFVYAASPNLQAGLGTQQYTVFGQVSAGMSALLAAARGGSDQRNGPGDGVPRLTVTIEHATPG